LSAASYFEAAAGFAPLPFQLAWMEQGGAAAIRSLEAPTGLGKTLATLVGWLWDRQQRPQTTPRRLVYQLPLRTLTEQIAVECRAVMGRLGVSIPVYVLRGGQIDNDYAASLATEAVIVGTLDQVVSRQLMRGYCCSRWSWPRHFAALNTDVRVVVDETQLQGAAVRTAIRLQEFHQKLGGPAPRELVLCSATLDASILPPGAPRHGLSAADYAHPVAARKVGRAKPLTLAAGADGAELVRAHHQEGTLTLVVVNQVRRAQELALQLADAPDGGPPTLLIHSRFRRAERQAIEARLRGFRGVVVATQTVEAGIDLDARLLITELCPWASFVQRCGRVGRNNTYDTAAVLVLEPDQALPYCEAELTQTRLRLKDLDDACVRNLMAVEAPAQTGVGLRLEEDKFLQLFDTHPVDHGDIDITDYLRVGEMRDVSVLWRGQPGPDMAAASDDELCPAPLLDVQQRFTTVWVPRGDGWELVAASKLAVGAVVAVPTDAGGYDPSLGWLPACIAAVPELPTPDVMGAAEDRSSFGSSVAVTLPQHLGDTREEAEELCEALAMAEPLAALLQRAAWLHDIGKAHPVFQATMRANGCGEGQWAKAPGWGSRHRRPGFRHELASALAALQLDEDPLVSYLLMAHHGKIRLQLQPYPWARDGPLHGVVEGETLPAVAGVCEAMTLHFPPTGLGKGWRNLSSRLLAKHGPFQLAWLEAALREADARASRRWQIPLAP
jgi:CRISPR-associated endonuclease/helicase Cas3